MVERANHARIKSHCVSLEMLNEISLTLSYQRGCLLIMTAGAVQKSTNINSSVEIEDRSLSFFIVEVSQSSVSTLRNLSLFRNWAKRCFPNNRSIGYFNKDPVRFIAKTLAKYHSRFTISIYLG